MPELPEVEAARRATADNCIGKKIVKAIIADDPKVIDGVSPKEFQSSLEGKTVVAAHRKGKNMWIELNSPPFPTFQFGMAGAIYIKGVAVTKYKRSAVKDDEEWPSKYSKVFLESFISGIGNWIADEVLYQAIIHPMQIASSISKEDSATLLKCINEVIEKAVEVGADSSQYPTSWIFHSREKKPGKAFVDGKKIEFITAGGRTSAFVPDLQKLTGTESQKAAAKRQQGKVQSDKHEANEEPEIEEAEGGNSKVKRHGINTKRASTNKKSKGSNSDNDDEGLKNSGKAKQDRSSSGKNGDQMKKTRAKNTAAKRQLEESDDNDDNSDSDDDNDESLNNPSGKAKQSRSSSGKDGDQKMRTRGKNTAAKRKIEQSDEDDNSDANEDGNGNERGRNHKLSSKTQSKVKNTTKQAAEPRQTRNKPSKKQK